MKGQENSKKQQGIKTNNKKLVVMIIAIIIIIILIVVGVVFINNRQKDNINAEQELKRQEEQKLKEGQNEDASLIDMNNVENVQIVDGNKVNNSDELKKEKTFSGMKVSDIKLETENGLTNFTATVENTSNEDFKEREITIVFKNKDGSEYERLPGYLPDIKKGESNKIDASTTSDLTNAYDFVIE